MVVRDLRVEVLGREPSRAPKRDALQALPGAGRVRVVVVTDGGVEGVGEVGFGRISGAPDALGALVERELKPLVLDQSMDFIRGIHGRLLSETEYHCHLAYSWVACWRHEKYTITIEVYYAGSRENAPY